MGALTSKSSGEGDTRKELEEDDFDFAERFSSLKAEFEAQLKEGAELNERIAKNLSNIQVDG